MRKVKAYTIYLLRQFCIFINICRLLRFCVAGVFVVVAKNKVKCYNTNMSMNSYIKDLEVQDNGALCG